MSLNPKIDNYYPNNFDLTMLDSLEEVMGRNEVNPFLHLANLHELIGNFPKEVLKKGLDFADISAINQAFELMYGPIGWRKVVLRASRATFADGLPNFGALAGMSDENIRCSLFLLNFGVVHQQWQRYFQN